MAQLSPQKRKKRRVQLREAQRRRRARLKEESKSYLQIILSQEMLLALRHYSDLVGKPLLACAAELIEGGLDRLQDLESRKQGQQKHAPILEDLPPLGGECLENSPPMPALEKIEDAPEDAAGFDVRMFRKPPKAILTGRKSLLPDMD